MIEVSERVRFKPLSKPTIDKEVRDEVYNYFKSNNLSYHANSAMVFKTIIIFSVMVGSYSLILSGILPLWGMWAMCVLLGVSWAGAGMCIMHDACHGSYSSEKWVNTTLGYTMNVLGGNRFNWMIQHNQKHHSYTNIYGVDEDLDNGGIIRLSPHSDYTNAHRFQHIYAWFLYFLGTLSWVFIKDYKQFKSLFEEANPINKKNINKELTIMISTKIAYYIVMLVVPYLVLNLPFWMILIGFITAHFVAGFILSVTFQLAHVVELTGHLTEEECKPLDASWTEHQLNTTANFCRKNKILNWYLGGLNFQIEHHLFPNICHVHYTKISKIVKDVVERHGLPYHEFETLGSAINSHYSSLKLYSKRPA